jgi:hypothetical protein
LQATWPMMFLSSPLQNHMKQQRRKVNKYIYIYIYICIRNQLLANRERERE